MNEITTTGNGPFNPSLKMSSLEIAELMEKRHDHVLRDIENLIEKGAIGAPNFGVTSYTSEQNKEYPMYELDFLATMVLITGYDANRRKLVIDRWLQLEMGEAVPAYLEKQGKQLIATAELIAMQMETIDLYRKNTALMEEKVARLEFQPEKRVNRPMLKEEEAEIIAMVASGMSQNQVAKTMRRSTATVSYLVRTKLREVQP